MLIGIDGNEANIKKRVGIGRYAYELIWQFYNHQTPSIKYKIFLKDSPKNDLPPPKDNWQYTIVGPKKFWTQLGLPLSLFLSHPKPDIFFSPTHYAPRFCPCPLVISIMDLSFLCFPEMFRKQDLWQLKSWTAYSIKKAVKILTISQASKNDIIKYYHVPSNRVVTTYPGYEMKFKNQNSKIKMKEPTILFVGKVEEKKGILDLFASFDRVRKMIPDIKLLVAGPAEKEMLKEFQEHKGVEYLGIIKNRDLPAYFQKSWITVTPSITTANWEEQVGMVNIQSMACGTPVISTYSGAIPEFVPDNLAGILVPEKKIDQLTAAIAKLILDDKLREKMGHSAAVYAAMHYDAAINVRKAEKFVMGLLKKS